MATDLAVKYRLPNLEEIRTRRYPESGLSGVRMSANPYEADPVTVIGTVRDEGGGGWEAKKGPYVVGDCSLRPWQVAGEAGPVTTELLLLARMAAAKGDDPYPDDRDWFKLPKNRTVRAVVRINRDRTRAVVCGPVVPLTKKEAGVELAAAAAELAKPVVANVEGVGRLTLNRDHELFEGEAKWNRRPVSLGIAADGDKPAAKAVRSMKSVFGNPADWKSRLEKGLAEGLLDLANSWAEQDDSGASPPKPMTGPQFVKRLSTVSIETFDDGLVTFGLDDGDTFWGHGIDATFTPRGRCEDTSISG